MSLGTAFTAKKALDGVVAAAYSAASRGLRTRFRAWRNQNKIRCLYKHIYKIRKVKTIWQLDKSVDLLQFYHPAVLLIEDDKFSVQSTVDLPSGNILIEGTLGLGKSILLRYLASVELYRGESIPVFIELRRIQQGETLSSHIVREFSNIGLAADVNTIEFLAARGQIVLFLDAFDELKESERERILTEIEGYARRNSKMKIIITSRPGSGIATSTELSVVQIAHLEQGDIRAVLRKLVDDKDELRRISNRIDEIGESLYSILNTPLLVALLVFRYRVDQSVPETLEAFYGDLFDVMLRRHDRSKPGGGVSRPRKSRLADSGLRRAFNALCFVTRRDDVGSMSTAKAWEFMKTALEEASIPAEASDVLEDIEQITCLIGEEGGEHGFVHKSIQEYHAACWVCQFSDQRARRFYHRVRGLWGSWMQELEFLSTMDAARFAEGFAISEMRRVFGIAEGDEPTMENRRPELLIKIFQPYAVHSVPGGSGKYFVLWMTNSWYWSVARSGGIAASAGAPLNSREQRALISMLSEEQIATLEGGDSVSLEDWDIDNMSSGAAKLILDRHQKDVLTGVDITYSDIVKAEAAAERRRARESHDPI